MNLIIQPEAGLAPVVKAIKRARQTVDLAIFRIDREEIDKALDPPFSAASVSACWWPIPIAAVRAACEDSSSACSRRASR